MPRINIDEKLFIDPRFTCLESKHGKNAAIGICIRLWFLAQKFYVPSRLPVPHNLLVMSGLPIDDLLDAQFMSKDEDHYWVYGCEDHFAWLLKSYENSKKGVEARRNKQPIGQPIASSIAEPIAQPTSSSSSSSSSSNKGNIMSGKPDFHPLCFEILEELNKALGKKYKPVASNLKHIASRLKENYVLGEFIKVIESKKEEWTGTNMETYLRPETLFGPKFNSYLQTAKAKKEMGNKW